MSIRTKIGIILLCAVIGFGLAEYGVQRGIILPGFLSLEREEAVRDSKRINDAIANEVKHLQSVCTDWATWDDTYDFVVSRSIHYIESNLPLTTFTNNKLSLIFICDGNGSVVWKNAYDILRLTPLSFSEFPTDRFPRNHPLFCSGEADGNTRPVSGMIMTSRGPMIVASCPILRSSGEGPARGFFIMGRLIGPEMMASLSEQTGVQSTLTGLGQDSGYDGKDAWFEIVSKDQLHVHSVFNNVRGEPEFLVSVVLPRPIMGKAYQTIHQGIYSILVVGLGVLILILFSLKRNVLDPLARFTEHTRILAETGDFSRRIAVSRRKDEIGILERRFDDLVARVEESARKISDTNRMLQADIEKRIQTETALRESEERFRTVVEQAADAVFLHDLEGRIRDANSIACERLGYSREDLLKMTVADIDPDSVARNGAKTYWIELAPRAPLIFESRHRRADGRTFPVEISLSPIRIGGERLILSLVRDITERRQIEERLRYTHKMEAITTLTAGISHNFNNMLSIIIGNAELAIDSTPPDSKVRKMLKNIESAGLRARDMVWKLIHFSQQTNENQRPVNMVEVVSNRVAALEQALPENIVLERQLDPDCPRILGNPEQIGQIVSNLWSNALDAMNETGGRLTITLAPADDPDTAAESGSKPGSHIRLSMSDTGRGIAAADIDRIFEPYFTTKDIVEGAGLGLSIVYGIVKNSGGSIRVDSRPGEGTRIDIFMPAATVDQVKHKPQPS